MSEAAYVAYVEAADTALLIPLRTAPKILWYKAGEICWPRSTSEVELCTVEINPGLLLSAPLTANPID